MERRDFFKFLAAGAASLLFFLLSPLFSFAKILPGRRLPKYDIGKSVDWLVKHAGDARWDVAFRAQETLAKAIEVPLHKSVLSGDIIGDIDENRSVWTTEAEEGHFTKRLISLTKKVMERQQSNG